MKQPSIVICGNYGASNLGDEAILDALCGFVEKAFDQPQITIMSANPDETMKLLRQYPSNRFRAVHFLPTGPRSLLKSFQQKRFRSTWKALKQTDIFVLGGGGLFTDERPRAILIWAVQAMAALLLKKPLICLGQSVGPLKTFLGRRVVSSIMKKARFITVRDEASAQLLQGLGISDMEILSDVVFSLPIRHNHRPHRQPYVVLSVRPWLPTRERNVANYQNVARFIDWLYEHKKYERSSFLSKILIHTTMILRHFERSIMNYATQK